MLKVMILVQNLERVIPKLYLIIQIENKIYSIFILNINNCDIKGHS